MNHLLACRVCLAHNTRLYSIKDGQLRDIYEKLVEASLDKEDMMPTSVCYLCFATMKKMLQFRARSQKANRILQQIISSGSQLSVSSLDMIVKAQTGQPKISWTLGKSDIERTTTNSAEDEVKVKIEPVESEMGIDGMSDWSEATPMYPFPGGSSLSPEMSQVASPWHTPNMYTFYSTARDSRSPDPSFVPIPSSSLSRSLEKGCIKSYKGSSSSASDKPAESSAANINKKNEIPHIKKPLNAFMLYMKEMRPKVVAECTLKESSAINQILGRQWHALGREEQLKYYELAFRERQLHKQRYPNYSAKHKDKKKRGRNKETTDGAHNLKKCRARYGLDQQNQWCEPCRRKKKCARYMEALRARAASLIVSLPMTTPQSPCIEEYIKLEELSDASDDEGHADTPPNSASSPGGLSALSSLLASPASDPPHTVRISQSSSL